MCLGVWVCFLKHACLEHFNNVTQCQNMVTGLFVLIRYLCVNIVTVVFFIFVMFIVAVRLSFSLLIHSIGLWRN